MFAKGIILILLLVLPVMISAEDMITLPTVILESILNQLKNGKELVESGWISIMSGLEKSEQNRIELQEIIERQDESITKIKKTTEKLEQGQTELRKDSDSSTEELSSLKSSVDKAEDQAIDMQKVITTLKIIQDIQTAVMIGEGIAIVVLGIILAGK